MKRNFVQRVAVLLLALHGVIAISGNAGLHKIFGCAHYHDVASCPDDHAISHCCQHSCHHEADRATVCFVRAAFGSHLCAAILHPGRFGIASCRLGRTLPFMAPLLTRAASFLQRFRDDLVFLMELGLPFGDFPGCGGFAPSPVGLVRRPLEVQGGVLKRLLLPGVVLRRVNLHFVAQIGDRDLIPEVSSRNRCFSLLRMNASASTSSFPCRDVLTSSGPLKKAQQTPAKLGLYLARFEMASFS